MTGIPKFRNFGLKIFCPAKIRLYPERESGSIRARDIKNVSLKHIALFTLENMRNFVSNTVSCPHSVFQEILF
jgi:hypothetical protein